MIIVWGHSFDARFAIKEPWTYRVFLNINTNDLNNGNGNDKPIKVFSLRNDNDAYVKFTKISKRHRKPILSTSTSNSKSNSNNSHNSDSNESNSPTNGSNGNFFQRGVTHKSTNMCYYN